MRSLDTRRIRRSISISMACLFMNGCAGVDTRKELSVVASVDLARYAGTWYEIARLPMWFQRHCVDSRAVYSMRADGKVGVHNECLTDDGKTDMAEGVATVVDPKTNARLSVVFDNWFARLAGPSHDGNYWILYLDDEYRTALVGTPDRQYLWILSRSPQMEHATFERLVEKGRDLGYPMDKLIRDRRPGDETESAPAYGVRGIVGCRLMLRQESRRALHLARLGLYGQARLSNGFVLSAFGLVPHRQTSQYSRCVSGSCSAIVPVPLTTSASAIATMPPTVSRSLCVQRQRRMHHPDW